MLEDNLASAELGRSADEHAAIEKISRPPMLYLYWHQAMNASDRFGAGDRVLHATTPTTPRTTQISLRTRHAHLGPIEKAPRLRRLFF